MYQTTDIFFLVSFDNRKHSLVGKNDDGFSSVFSTIFINFIQRCSMSVISNTTTSHLLNGCFVDKSNGKYGAKPYESLNKASSRDSFLKSPLFRSKLILKWDELSIKYERVVEFLLFSCLRLCTLYLGERKNHGRNSIGRRDRRENECIYRVNTTWDFNLTSWFNVTFWIIGI